LSNSPFSSSSRQKGVKNDSKKQHEKEEEVRIFMDGAFDLLHYGHMNAFRLGRSLGTHLIVGLNSDESITTCKGSAPLMNDKERLTMVAACKFVDEVVPDCPYIMNKQYLDFVIDKYRIDFVIHGDDPCIVDGKDVYATAKAAGKYRQIPRTEGVSTTDIVGRMLVMTKEHHYQEVIETDGHDGNSSTIDDDDGSATSEATKASNASSAESASEEQQTSGPGQQQQPQSKFVNTSRMLQLFSSDIKAPVAGMKIVYIDGAWDLFHPGHVAILKAAREMGDYLVVGIHGDAVVNQIRGMNLPLMNLHERVLSVLGCRHVNDVVIDAPYVITADFLDSHNIALVVYAGRHEDDFNSSCSSGNDDEATTSRPEQARFRHVQSRGILVDMDDISSNNTITPSTSFCLGNIVSRIKRNQEMFQAKFERKSSIEREFYKEKQSRQQQRSPQRENSSY
jgi:ethanolamine-phosphate cytidylyltransferase